MSEEKELYNQLAYYTLSKADSFFIHQLVVDAFAAQNADENTKPITLAFAIAGLYLHNEKCFTGKQVQNAHIFLAKDKKEWPRFTIPKDVGTITITDVLDASPGIERDMAIENWSASVWQAWKESHSKVKEWLENDYFKKEQ